MRKKYIVKLSDAERETLTEIVRNLKGSSQRVRRAQVLLKADADGPAWTDAKIAEAFGCRTKTVENIRERLVTEGLDVTLQGKPHARRPKVAHGGSRGEVDRNAAQFSAEGLRELDAATASGSHCGTAYRADDQHTDGASHAKKNTT